MAVSVKLLKDSIREELAKRGISEAASVEVIGTNGDSIMIVSPNNPALERPASEFREIRPRASAKAGRGFSV